MKEQLVEILNEIEKLEERLQEFSYEHTLRFSEEMQEKLEELDPLIAKQEQKNFMRVQSVYGKCRRALTKAKQALLELEE